jgi:nucleoside-diphosphate-sugar epimerase
MRVFVTGATGFIGTELVKELIAAGHRVRALTRSEVGAERLKAAGVEVHRGDLQDLHSLRSGATDMDAVVNLAFNHDWSKFAQSAADEIKAIEALGSVLEPGKLLLVTSGIGITSGAPGQVRKETDPATDSPAIPRRPEQAARAAAAKGVRVGIVRLPQVHDTRKQGLVTMLIQIAREKGVSAYVGDGATRWAAGPLKDVGRLYRLALEKTGSGMTTYHAVQEEGVPLREVAETIGRRALRYVRSLCDLGYACFERVDAQGARLGADRAGIDRGFGEDELLTCPGGAHASLSRATIAHAGRAL